MNRTEERASSADYYDKATVSWLGYYMKKQAFYAGWSHAHPDVTRQTDKIHPFIKIALTFEPIMQI